MTGPLDCVFLGLSITSTWGNGHATTYRGLLKELARNGHRVTFLERDVPWYAEHREFHNLAYAQVHLYSTIDELQQTHAERIRRADLVVIGSYVPEGIAVSRWVLSVAEGMTAFYDIDTPVTLANLQAGKCEYLSADLIPRFDLYLSFTGGPTLRWIEQELRSPCSRPLYCSVDPGLYFPEPTSQKWDLGYVGTYAADRQPALDRMLIDVAQCRHQERFVVAGPLYPDSLCWPSNVERIEHLPANEHRQFYSSQRFTLNLTRQDMVRAGYSPSVRLFEAAACGVPIISDEWPGLSTIFEPGKEIFTARSTADVEDLLSNLSASRHDQVAQLARTRTLRDHTAAVRATELESYVDELQKRSEGFVGAQSSGH